LICDWRLLTIAVVSVLEGRVTLQCILGYPPHFDRDQHRSSAAARI